MNKGVLASVAALATSAGVAFGQGAPSAAPQAFPAWGGAAMTPGPAVAPPVSFLPTAGEMPHVGAVGGGPSAYPGFEPAFGGDPGSLGSAMENTQIHKAAGGPDRVWLDIEHLAWRPRAMPIAFPLAVVSPPAAAGIIGAEGTRVVFGDDNLDYGAYINALRLTFGVWDSERVWGAELSGFIQEAKSDIGDFHATINSRQALARPLIDALTGTPSAVLVGFPGQFNGDIFINARLKLGGAEANVVRSLVYCDRFKLSLVGGLRYIDHDETLQITSRSTLPNTILPTDPTFVDIFDEFACRNQFIGGQAGFEMEIRHRRLFADITAKCAVGNQNEQLVTRGFTNTQISGNTSTVPFGMLVLEGNTVNNKENELAYVPEFTLKLGYQLTQRLSTYIGYNALYISRLLRPGDQIDPVINPTLLPVSQLFGGTFGPVRPLAMFNKSDFWTQGVTMGLSIRY